MRSILKRRGPARIEPLEPRQLMSVEVISVAAGGASTGNGASPALGSFEGGDTATAVSDDGRYVAFTSDATDLVAGLSPDGTGDVFVRDRATGTTVCATVGPGGNPLGGVDDFGMSADGRFVAFTTNSPGFPGDDTSPFADSNDVFLRDLVAGTTTLVNRTPTGARSNAQASFQAISRNGRYVVFGSESTDLDPAVSNFGPSFHFFRYDAQTGSVKFVTDRFHDSTAPVGSIQMSDDGERVAYVGANDFDTFTGLTWSDYNVFVKDFTTGGTIVASLDSAGQPLDAEEGSPNSSLDYRLSGDGQRVAFITTLPGITPDTPGEFDQGIDNVYVRDLASGTTTLVTAGGTIPEAGGEFIYSLEISRDGRYVLFATDRNFSGLPDLNGSVEEPESDVYVRDLQTGAVRLVSGNAAGTGEVGGYAPDMSADGRYVVFETANPYATPDDVDFGTSVVLRDLVAGGTLLLNRRPDGTIFDWGEDASFDRVISASGNLLVFTSFTNDVAANFAPAIADANGTAEDVLAMPLAGVAPPALTPPAASTGLLPTVVDTGAATYEFDVTFSDAQFIDSFAIEGDEIVVTGPGGFRQAATIVTFPPDDVAKSVTFRYSVAAPGGTFGPEDDGLYTIEVLPDQVRATSGLAVPGGPVVNGVFGVDIPRPNGPDLEATALTGAVPASVMSGPGAKMKLKPLTFRVINSGNQPADGVVTVRLVASADAVADPNDPVVAELPNQKLKLAPGKSKTFKLKPAAFPAVADGDYHLFAIVDAGGAMTERRELNNSAGLGTPVRIAAANSDIGVASPTLTGRLAPGKKATLLLTATNGGNVVAKGAQPVRVRFTTSPSDANAVSRTVDTSLKLNLKPGATKALRAKLTLPGDLAAGSYFVVVELLSGAPWSDPNAANNIATSAGAYTV